MLVCQKIILFIKKKWLLYFDLLCIVIVMFSNDFCEYWSRLIPALEMCQLIQKGLLNSGSHHVSDEEGSDIIIPEMFNYIASNG